jgi:hypothetical protein
MAGLTKRALEHETRHPDKSVDVRLEDGPLVLLGRFGHRRATEGQPGRVHEYVNGPGGIDETLAARRIGHIELEGDIRLQPFDAAGTTDHPSPRREEPARCGCADPTRRSCDDRRSCQRATPPSGR